MSFRFAMLSLALVPALSWADEPAGRASSPRTPKQAQAESDRRGVPERLPANGRVRIPVFIGQPDNAAIRLVENGQPVAFERKVVMPAVRNDTPWIELVPARALTVDAAVIVFVADVRSGTYRIGPPDLTPPEVASAEVQSFEVDLPAQVHTWGLGRPPRDEVQVSVRVVDDGSVRVRGVLLPVDGKPPVESINTALVASGINASSLLVFPPGSIQKGRPGQLRVEAVDVAGNVGTSKPIELAPPAPASADASAEPPHEPAPRPVGRGCG